MNVQPVAGPDSMPTQNGVSPLAIIVPANDFKPSHDVGTSYPLASNLAGLYQTRDFRSDFVGIPYWTPSTSPNAVHASDQCSATAESTSDGNATRYPSRAKSANLPGWGNTKMSGGFPPAACALIWSEASRVPV